MELVALARVHARSPPPALYEVSLGVSRRRKSADLRSSDFYNTSREIRGAGNAHAQFREKVALEKFEPAEFIPSLVPSGQEGYQRLVKEDVLSRKTHFLESPTAGAWALCQKMASEKKGIVTNVSSNQGMEKLITADIWCAIMLL